MSRLYRVDSWVGVLVMVTAEQVVECDVLVIGGGGAGLAAAIAARQGGVSVAMASKGKAGRGGNTMLAGAGFAAVVPFEGSDDSPEQHFQDTLAGGKGINDEALLRVFVSQAASHVGKVQEWGVSFRRSNGDLLRREVPGHSRARALLADSRPFPAALGGLSVTLPLRATAERMGVRFLDDTPAIRLTLLEGEACGALGIDVPRDQLVLVKARSVVVAAGGAGRIFARTNNTRDVCGDSCGLLLRAGATLRDTEFVQVFPSQIASPIKAPASTTIFSDGAVLRNRHGERFMHLYDPINGETATRDVLSQAIFQEVKKGNGIEGEVYMDCTAVPEAVLQNRYVSLARDLRKRGIDLARDWVKVAPTFTFSWAAWR